MRYCIILLHDKPGDLLAFLLHSLTCLLTLMMSKHLNIKDERRKLHKREGKGKQASLMWETGLANGIFHSLFTVLSLGVVTDKVVLFVSALQLLGGGFVCVPMISVLQGQLNIFFDCMVYGFMPASGCLSGKSWRVEEGLLFNYKLVSGCYCRWWSLSHK